MIKSFVHRGLEDFFFDGSKKGITPNHAKKLERILDRLDAASTVEDMLYPGSFLHLLEPKNEGRWSVRVSKSWRVVFRFHEGNAYEVDYINYH